MWPGRPCSSRPTRPLWSPGTHWTWTADATSDPAGASRRWGTAAARGGSRRSTTPWKGWAMLDTVRRARLLWLLAVAVLVLAGCGGGGDDEGAEDAEPAAEGATDDGGEDAGDDDAAGDDGGEPVELSIV